MESINSAKKCLVATLFAALLGVLALSGCSALKEERVFDAAYDAEDIIVFKLGLEYEHLHMGDLPFYTGGNERQVILYANAEDAGLPFDRMWIYPCETESEAIAVLDDIEAWLNDPIPPWRDLRAYSRMNDTSLHGWGIACATGPVPDGSPEPWERKAVVPELVEEIVADQNWDADSLGEGGQTWWDISAVDVYARRHKTMVLIMDKVYYRYEVGENMLADNHTYAAGNDEEWAAEIEAFDEFFENVVDTDAFWE